MTGIELSEETKQQDERGGAPDVVVGIAGAIAAADLRARAEQMVADLGPNAFAADCFRVARAGTMRRRRR